jgi:hypothetical protein
MPNALNPYDNFTGSGGSSLDRNLQQVRPYDERVGNGPLPPGIQGAANAAYVRTPQANELSGTRISALLASDNPYMRNAQQRGLEVAGRRGLLNSSMAAGSAQRSAIEAAAPLALQEAGVFEGAASDNQQYLNQLALAAQERSTAEENRRAALAAGGERDATRLQMQREDLAFRGEQSGLDRSHQNYRDYTGFNYQDRLNSGNQARASQYANQEYAFRTGVDMRAGRYNLRQALIQRAIEDPELWTPEDIEGFDAVTGSWLDETTMGFDDWYSNNFDYDWGDF